MLKQFSLKLRNAQEERNKRSAVQATTMWSKPLSGRYKCNIDTSFFTTVLNKVDIGICIKDDQWHFVLTKIEWFLSIFEMDVGETIWLLNALN